VEHRGFEPLTNYYNIFITQSMIYALGGVLLLLADIFHETGGKI
jgi:hypothetical protein